MTNPSLMKKAGAQSWNDARNISVDILKLLHPYPVSLELTEVTEKTMIEQAQDLAAWGENWPGKVAPHLYHQLRD